MRRDFNGNPIRPRNRPATLSYREWMSLDPGLIRRVTETLRATRSVPHPPETGGNLRPWNGIGRGSAGKQ